MSVISKTGISAKVSDARFKYLPKKSGNCLNIANVNEGIGPINFAWPTRYTIFFRLNPNSLPGSARLIDGLENEILLTVSGIKVQHNAGSITTNSGVLIQGEVHDYAIVYDGQFVRTYRDLVPVDAKALTTNPLTAARDYYIFNRSDGQRNCDGKFAEFQFYGIAFSPDEIVAHGRSNPNEQKNLLLRLKLDEGSGAIAHDSSLNGRDGTIIGGTWQTYKMAISKVTYGDVSVTSLRRKRTFKRKRTVFNRIPNAYADAPRVNTSDFGPILPLADYGARLVQGFENDFLYEPLYFLLSIAFASLQMNVQFE